MLAERLFFPFCRRGEPELHNWGMSCRRTDIRIMQERRKVELQLAAEAEAAGKVKANLLRENIRKANQKVLVEAQRLRTEGKATREAASQALLATLSNQMPAQYSSAQTSELGTSSCASLVGEVLRGSRGDVMHEAGGAVLPSDCAHQRMTADDVLLRQRFAGPQLGLTDLLMSKVTSHHACLMPLRRPSSVLCHDTFRAPQCMLWLFRPLSRTYTGKAHCLPVIDDSHVPQTQRYEMDGSHAVHGFDVP